MNVLEQMAQRDFEQVVCNRDPLSGISSIIAVHDTSLGPSLGGVRMRRYSDDDAALADAMNLAEAMTYKAAIAGLAHGGGKSVINADPDEDKNVALLEAHARFVTTLGGRYVPAVDMGTDSQDLAIMARHATVSCNTQNPSSHTARGVFRAIESTVKAMNTSLVDLRVAVQGLGHVGRPLVGMLADAGAKVSVADLDAARVQDARTDHGAIAVPVDEIVTGAVDLLVPAAAGGVITEEILDRLRARMIVPAANNALTDDELATELAERGIVYIPDFVANAGGLMACDAEVHATGSELDARVDGIGDTVAAVLDRAGAHGVTPLRAALDLAAERLRAARSDRPWMP